MADRRSRMGAANLSVPLMILTFGLIGGFLWWLNMNAEPTSLSIVEDTGPAQPGAMGTPVSEQQLREDPERFVGQVVRVEDMAVAMAVGSRGFFLDVPDMPFLVMLDEALVQQGTTVPQGRVTVAGPMLAMNDSIMGNWMGRGLIPERDQILVEFATYFIEARSVEAPPEDE